MFQASPIDCLTDLWWHEQHDTNPELRPEREPRTLATIPAPGSSGRYMQYGWRGTVLQNGSIAYQSSGFHGFQVFQSTGRLYTLFGDAGQDIGAP